MTWTFDTAVRTLWQEARGEPLVGQQAVAWVIRNRLQSGRWGHSLASVCLWRAQFSGWYVPSDPNFSGACNLSDTDPVLEKLAQVLTDVMQADQATDPTDGAMWYYAASMTTPPAWAETAIPCGAIGHQIFFKGVQ